MANTKISKKEKTVRVFFAICPDSTAKKKLASLAEKLESACGGRKVNTQAIHLTLVFLGEVDIKHIETLCSAVKDITAKVFDFSVERTTYWKHNRIIYAATEKCPTELLVLVNSLQRALSEAGFSFDERPYVPHITLVRKARHRVITDLEEPISWRVHEWLLMQSEQTDKGINYIPLGRWSLK